MMKNIRSIQSSLFYGFALLLFVGLSLSSCQTSNSLSDGGIVQKRKYQKGYHLNIKDPLAFNKSARRVSDSSMEPTVSLDAKFPEKIVKQELAVKASANKRVQKSTLGPQKAKRNKTKANKIAKEDVAKPLTITSTYTKQNLVVTPDPENDYYAEEKELNILALLSFIFAILSLIIFAIPFGAAAAILGILAIIQIEQNPDAYKGKGFAIVGLIIGIIAVIIGITYINSQM